MWETSLFVFKLIFTTIIGYILYTKKFVPSNNNPKNNKAKNLSHHCIIVGLFLDIRFANVKRGGGLF